MPVISQENEFILDRLELDNFWHHRSFSFSVDESTKILSFVQKIPVVDPLAVLQQFAPTNTLRFYWENPSKQEAIAAWGITRNLTIESNARFAKTQSFIKSCFKQIISEGDTNINGSEARIFCSFSFFSQSELANKSHPAATIFLPRFQIAKKNKNHFFIVNFPLVNQQNLKQIKTQFSQKIQSIDWSRYEQLSTREREEVSWEERNLFSAQNSQYFKSTVRSALDSIAIDELSKIVIAHAVDIKSEKHFNVTDSLSNLRERHPDCYIFAIGNDRGQDFIGASPERLVSIQNKQLVTDALAGSAPRGKSTSEDVQWANILLKNRKEKREHQAVSDFILERLQDMGLKPHQLPLQLLQLSNIQHLWTPIYAHLPKGIDPLDIVAQLHPTPAVAGVPNKIVFDKIRHYEKFDRALYAAPLGWIDRRENCEFVVGIRSALIEKNRARLYAGAGIVSGSNPDKEFVEIQLKLQSLLKALV
ncbi:isochorismate synthase [Hyella patelloides]|nr:isochorismate synthase [Hyella patelloides]